MERFFLDFGVYSVTSRGLICSHFPSKHLSQLPSEPQVHHHISQYSLEKIIMLLDIRQLLLMSTSHGNEVGIETGYGLDDCEVRA
jgi:hypothetical protein